MMKRITFVIIGLVAVGGWLLLQPSIGGEKKAEAKIQEPTKAPHLRLFGYDKGEKRYYSGYDWMNMNINDKIQLVEEARNGALKMNVVMTMPAEIYVGEVYP